MSQPIIQHLGIIMDGNRRWAKNHKLPTVSGHQHGYNTVLKVGDWCFKRNIKILTVWAFSTENWKRKRQEVSFLMKLLKKGLTTEINKLHQKNVKVRILGRLNELSPDLQTACRSAMEKTKNNTGGILNIALNYGGQAEIIDAVNLIIKNKINKVDEKIFQKYLYDSAMPAPDLIIRTSGELRTSGFLLWHAAYSELYFCKKYWPEFSEQDLVDALEDYQNRARRFGGN